MGSVKWVDGVWLLGYLGLWVFVFGTSGSIAVRDGKGREDLI